jgi:exodeoxyribonuclease VII small subunit
MSEAKHGELPFEQALARLEEIVRLLEKGDVPLDQAIGLYQEGVWLVHHCGQKLEWAQQQVEMLVEENGEWVKKPFLTEEETE